MPTFKKIENYGVAVVERSTRRLGDREVRGSNLGAGETFFLIAGDDVISNSKRGEALELWKLWNCGSFGVVEALELWKLCESPPPHKIAQQ